MKKKLKGRKANSGQGRTVKRKLRELQDDRLQVRGESVRGKERGGQ